MKKRVFSSVYGLPLLRLQLKALHIIIVPQNKCWNHGAVGISLLAGLETPYRTALFQHIPEMATQQLLGNTLGLTQIYQQQRPSPHRVRARQRRLRDQDSRGSLQVFRARTARLAPQQRAQQTLSRFSYEPTCQSRSARTAPSSALASSTCELADTSQ